MISKIKTVFQGKPTIEKNIETFLKMYLAAKKQCLILMCND